MRRSPSFGNGRVVALTGAASGIGRALAERLGRAGASLALADIDEARLADVVYTVRAGGGTAHGRILDVADAAEVDDWAAEVVGRFGSVEMIWNVAGIINAGTVEQSDRADLERLMAVDFWGVVHGTTAFLPHVLAAGGGHVVNVSSAFGLISAPGYGGYNAAKFAVRGWTEALRQEMRARRRDGGPEVHVTCVYPAGIRTPIMAGSTSAAGPQDAARRREIFESRIARIEPDRAALVILRGVRAGRSRVLVGRDAYVADLLARVTGTGYHRLIELADRMGLG
jgi:NAD(P)-dependent dehydrogenase (short-subunit alcohol dehydrogenase family)